MRVINIDHAGEGQLDKRVLDRVSHAEYGQPYRNLTDNNKAGVVFDVLCRECITLMAEGEVAEVSLPKMSNPVKARREGNDLVFLNIQELGESLGGSPEQVSAFVGEVNAKVSNRYYPGESYIHSKATTKTDGDGTVLGNSYAVASVVVDAILNPQTTKDNGRLARQELTKGVNEIDNSFDVNRLIDRIEARIKTHCDTACELMVKYYERRRFADFI